MSSFKLFGGYGEVGGSLWEEVGEGEEEEGGRESEASDDAACGGREAGSVEGQKAEERGRQNVRFLPRMDPARVATPTLLMDTETVSCASQLVQLELTRASQVHAPLRKE